MEDTLVLALSLCREKRGRVLGGALPSPAELPAARLAPKASSELLPEPAAPPKGRQA
jgi:hypothetical protein